MNIARINFSHGDLESHKRTISSLRKASQESGIPVAIMIDLRGPEIRTGITENNEKIRLVQGEKINVTSENVTCSEEILSITYPNLDKEIKEGAFIYIADGLITLEVLEVRKGIINCLIKSGGEIGSRKNVNIRGIRLSLPSVTEKDRKDILFAVSEKVDYIAASFVRKSGDVIDIRNILDENQSDIHVISKIEDEEGVENIDKIINVSHGVMVARGDLGVQIDTEEIPLVQKRIIRKCNLANKPVITATQMLDSMIFNSRPTRAETNDVATAIFEGTDAVMLSGETAAGKYPVLSVETMHRIAYAVEKSHEYKERSRFISAIFSTEASIADSIAKSAFSIAADISADAILTPTLHGTTPKLISKYRPLQNVIACTTTPEIQRKLLLYWGIHPIVTEYATDSDEMITNAIKTALDANLVRNCDKIVVVAGIPINSPVMINTIKVHLICNVLEKGRKGFGGMVSGKIKKVRDISDAVMKIAGSGDEILLTKNIDETFKPLIPRLKGILLEGFSTIPQEELQLLNPDMVFISGVSDAMKHLENGLMVSIDGKQKLVYEGVIKAF